MSEEEIKDEAIVVEQHEDGAQSTTVGVELIDGGTINLSQPTKDESVNPAPEKCIRCGVTFGFVPGWRNDVSQMWWFCSNCSYPLLQFRKKE